MRRAAAAAIASALATVGAAPAGASELAVLPDGTPVVGGDQFALTRLSPAGTPEGTFRKPPGADGLTDLAVAPDGTLVAAGYRRRGGGRPAEPLMARYSAGGALRDTRSEPVGEGDAVARAVAVAPDGDVITASDAVRDGRAAVALQRGEGAATVWLTMPGRALTAAAVEIDGGSGDAVVAGNAYDPERERTNPFLARVAPDGSLRSLALSPAEMEARALALQPGGGAVIVGTTRVDLKATIVATTADWTTTIPAESEAFASAAIAATGGGTFVAGTAASGADTRPLVLRLTADGALEPSLALFPQSGSLEALARDPTGGLIATGSTFARYPES